MRVTTLERAWPQYWETHKITKTELARIANNADDLKHAQHILENDDWWQDLCVPEMIFDVRHKIINQIIERVKDHYNDEVCGQCLHHLHQAADHLHQALKVLPEQPE